MKEKDFIQTIKTILNSEYIGDDCACLKDLGIVVTQDSLVEDIHFRRDFATPYQIGYKSAMVNISDVCASGAEPKYLTVALSLPENITKEFVEEFYKGMKDACGNIEIVTPHTVKQINGDGSKVTSVTLDDNTALICDGIFIFTGIIPSSGIVKDLVELDRQGFIITDAKMETSLPGIFACGDIRTTPFRQVVTAAGDGAIAAHGADEYISSH